MSRESRQEGTYRRLSGGIILYIMSRAEHHFLLMQMALISIGQCFTSFEARLKLQGEKRRPTV